MKIKAIELGPKDFGSSITVRNPSGTVTSRIICGVNHFMVRKHLDEENLVLEAEYHHTSIKFLDGTSMTVASHTEVEFDPETAILVKVIKPHQTGLR